MPTFFAEAETEMPLQLPDAPAHLEGPVKAWSEPIVLPSYMPAEGDRNPMFLRNRAYQGSSGKVYPMAMVDGISSAKQLWQWDAVHIENDFVRVTVLPEMGGRIHVALDKTNGHDFVYRADAVKPVFSGLAGPWLAGGIQFEWPSSGRPGSFASSAVQIEEHADGARTVWFGEHDPMTRMKSAHGVCLYPGRSYIEIKVRLFNRTPLAQTFLWWTTAGVAGNKQYQPLSPDEDFFGGYDHANRAGIVHVADRWIVPGRKVRPQENGAFINLTAGAYSHNQADFSYIAPYETKMFSEYWYPIREIDLPSTANVDAAVSLQVVDGVAHVGVAVTSMFPGATASLEWNGLSLASWTRNLAPGEPLFERADLRPEVPVEDLSLVVTTSKGRELIRYAANADGKPGQEPLPVAIEPAEPKKVATVDELYWIGTHLDQQHHPSRRPEDYWEEGLRRSSGDVRCALALGRRHLERGEFQEAEELLRRAIGNLTRWNGNPPDGETFYLLGLCLRYTDRDDEAYDAFYKAAWSYAWRAPALYELAAIDVKQGRWEIAPKHLHEASRLNADNNKVRCLFRRFGRTAQAEALLGEALSLDPLDAWARHLAGQSVTGDNGTRIDVALDYLRAGLYTHAVEVLTAADLFARDGTVPMVHYVLGYAYARSGNLDDAERAYAAAGDAPADRCFPYRLEELIVLESAVMTDPADARAFQYLGNWLYAHRRDEQAIDCWQIATRLQPALATPWRNLGVALFNSKKDGAGARQAYEQAFAADPSDARVFYERDQLWKHLNLRPSERLREMEAHRDLVALRDLSLELAGLYNLTEQPEKAQEILLSRPFQPLAWDEGAVLAQYVRTKLKLGKRCLRAGKTGEAVEHFQAALHPPESLGEARRLEDDDAEIHFWLGEAASAAHNVDVAITHWQRAASQYDRPREGGESQFTEQTVYAALAKGRLGERRESRTLLRQLWFYGRKLARERARAEYFAITTPPSRIFEEDSLKQSRIEGLLLQTQARMGMAQWKLARKALEQVLALDPNHERASELVTTFAYEQSGAE